MGSPLLLTFLRFRIIEGSSVTLFGLFNYDSASDSFSVTDFGNTFFAGGVTEIKRILADKLSYSNDTRNFLLKLIAFCIVASSFAMYIGLERQIKNLLHNLETKRNILKFGERKLKDHREKATPECIVCMENVANVVLVPCNHLLMCMPCCKDLRAHN